MGSESQYVVMKKRLAEVKQLFQTRHYVQCATLCEQLTRATDEIHPVHLAYLHFYLAMSHDTMARETTWKHRSTELDLAEQHYLAALAALSASAPQEVDNVLERSPSSPSSEDDLAVKGRRVSDASQESIASSATSLAESDTQSTPRRVPSSSYLKARALFEKVQDNSSTPPKSQSSSSFRTPRPAKRRPAPIILPYTTHSHHEGRFSAELISFIAMIKTHLDNVRQLKETPVAFNVRFSVTRSRSSTASPRPISRDSSSSHESEVEGARWARRAVNFRQRFNPESVRQLCNEALAEL
ncbi:hypothetical protein K458DRAFT_60428 [Lentithecium fluviatile CBS 122367]|uniref:Uncharacterized protein n=1 Tax=Lentithecium fluviatile CBS 122367 TaxID=1168545 RepID=A0A6G1IWB4_9PLEO|nr:hypothetical protein K458DRAFT_60428 [Lentithecium fluviatile CBS 122367]